VLLIERDADAAASLAKSLATTEGIGFELVHANGLASGLEHLGHGGIDAVLLAVRSAQGPELDGLRQLRANAPGVPVLVLADATDPYGIEPVRRGAQDCLEKGQLSPRTLAHALHCAVERAGRRATLQQRLLDLKANESRLHTVVEHAADGILVVDGAGIIRFLNPACAALLGRSSDELLDSAFEFPVVAEGAMELELGPHHAKRTVEMSVRDIVWAGAPAYLATLRDITERKLAEQALLASRPRDDRHDEQAARRIAELEEMLQGTQAELETMNAKLRTTQGSQDGRLVDALQRTTELEQALEAAQHTLTEQIAAREESQAALERAQVERDEARAQASQHGAERAEAMDQLRAQLEEQTEVRTRLEQAVRRLEEEDQNHSVDAGQRIAELEQGLATEHQKLEESASQRAELEALLQQTRGDVEKATAQLQARSAERAAVEQAERRSTELEQSLEEANRAREAAEQARQAGQQAIAEVAERSSTLERSLEEARQQLQTQGTEQAALEQARQREAELLQALEKAERAVVEQQTARSAAEEALQHNQAQQEQRIAEAVQRAAEVERRLRESVAEQEQRSAQASQRSAQLAQELEEAHRTTAQKTAEYRAAQEALAQAHRERDEALATANRHDAEIEESMEAVRGQLQQEVAARIGLEQTLQGIEKEHKARVAELDQVLAAQRQKTGEAEARTTELAAQLRETEAGLESVEQARAEQDQRLTQAQQCSAELERALAEQAAERKPLEEALAQARAQADERFAQAAEQRGALEQALQETREQLQAQQAGQVVLEQTLQRETELQQALDSAEHALAEQTTAREAAQEALECVRSEQEQALAEASRHGAELEKSMDALRAELKQQTELRIGLEQAQQRAAQEHQQRVAGLEALLQQTTANLESVGAKLRAVEQAYQSQEQRLTAAAQRSAELEQGLQQAQHELAEQSAARAAAEDAVQQSRAEAEQRVAQATQQNTELQQQLHQRQQALAEHEQHLAEAGERSTRLEQDLHEVRDNLEQASRAREAAEHEQQLGEQALAEAKRQGAEFEQALNEQSAARETVEQALEHARVEAGRREAELEHSIGKLRGEVQQQAEARAGLEQALQRAGEEHRQRIDELERAMQRTQEALERLVAESWRVADGLHLFEEAFANAAEGLMITDADHVIRSVNAAFSAITGYAADEAAGQTPRLLRSGRHDREFYRAMQQSLDEHGRWQGEIWSRRRDGEIYPQWQSVSAIPDAQGRVVYYVTVFHDISDRVRRERELEKQLHRDAVTGLANRSMLLDFLRSILGGPHSGRQLAVLVIDLDIGEAAHAPGVLDEPLLVAAAERLRGCARPYDLVARTNDAQLSIALADLGSDEPAQLAGKILAALSAPYPLGRHTVCLAPSIGISAAADRDVAAERLFEEALSAVRNAHERGGNTFQLHDPATTGSEEANHG